MYEKPCLCFLFKGSTKTTAKFCGEGVTFFSTHAFAAPRGVHWLQPLFQLLQNQWLYLPSSLGIYDPIPHFKILKLLDPSFPFPLCSLFLPLINLICSFISSSSAHIFMEVFLGFRIHSHFSCQPTNKNRSKKPHAFRR